MTQLLDSFSEGPRLLNYPEDVLPLHEQLSRLSEGEVQIRNVVLTRWEWGKMHFKLWIGPAIDASRSESSYTHEALAKAVLESKNTTKDRVDDHEWCGGGVVTLRRLSAGEYSATFECADGCEPYDPNMLQFAHHLAQDLCIQATVHWRSRFEVPGYCKVQVAA